MEIRNIECNEIKNLDEYYDYDGSILIQNEQLGKDAIIIDSPIWRVENMGILVAEGVYMAYDENAREGYPDWSVTVIYEDVKDEEFDPQKYIYFEQDPPSTAIHNFLNYRREHENERA